MNKRLVYGIVSRTVAFAVLILTSKFLLDRNGFVYEIFNIDLSFMLYPLLVASATFYMATIFGVFLTGELADVVIGNVKVFALGLFFSIIVMNSPVPREFHPLGFWLLIGVTIVVFNRVMGAVSDCYRSNLLRVFSRSVSLFAGGYVLSKMMHTFPNHIYPEFISSPERIVFYSFMVASAVSLLGVFERSRNSYLSYIGKKFGTTSGLFSTFLLVMFLLFYFFNLRPIIVGQYSNYVVVFEWSIVCLASFVIYRNVKSYVAKSLAEDLRLGKWKRLVQTVVFNKDQVDEVSKVAEKFVEDGFKEGILIYLISTLLENGIPYSDIEAVISELVDYEDPPAPKLMFHWRLEDLERENKTRRIEVLRFTLNEASRVLHVSSPSEVLGEELGRDLCEL